MTHTTHIGSLPFLDLDKTIEFNSRFDIPVLSTLPKLDSNEFMIDQVVFGMKNVEHSNFQLSINSQIKLEDFQFQFCLRDLFIKAFKNKTIKWQILGPVTLLKLFKTPLSSKTKNKILSWHSQNILNFHKELTTEFSKVIFFLDEPMLSTSDDMGLLNRFLDMLSLDNMGMHNCSELNICIINKLPSNLALSFDMKLLNDELIDQLGRSKNPLYNGIIDTLDMSLLSATPTFLQYAYAVTPSCGLALSDINKVLSVPEKLKTVTQGDKISI